MAKLTRLYLEVYEARRAREAAIGTPAFAAADKRVSEAFEAVRRASGFGVES